MKRCTAVSLAAALVLGAGSGVWSQPSSAPSAASKPVFLIGAPLGAEGVVDAKKHVKKGDRVVLRGKIGGSAEPFIEKRAMFTVVDLALKSCDQRPDDHCRTPWDYCCDGAKTIAAHAATVQVVGADGKVLREGLKRSHGLEPLKVVTVAGTVERTDNASVLVVNAEDIFVEGSAEAAPASLFVKEEPAGAVDGAAAKGAKAGETVTVRGTAGGFETGRAVFTVGDGVTVRVVGANGEPLGASARGAGGLKEGAEVVVRGTVREGGVVDAAAVWVAPVKG